MVEKTTEVRVAESSKRDATGFAISKNDIIEVAEEYRTRNPKREGTLGYDQFKIVQKFHGKTVGEFREAADKAAAKEDRKSWANAELKWNYEHNFIDLLPSADEAAA